MTKPSNGIAMLLAFVPGLVGLFGLGHVYLGRTRRGLGFLLVSLGLYTLLAIAVFVPGISMPIPVLPGIWFISWVVQVYDVRRRPVTRLPPFRGARST